MLEAEFDQALVAAAGRVVMVADHSKWGVRGLSSIAPLDAADVLVTDNALGAPAREVLRDRVGELVVVKV